MRSIISSLVIFFSLFFALEVAASPVIGEPAPAFEVTDINGNTHTLAGYADKIVILEWHNPECPFVKKHYDTDNMIHTQNYATDKDIIWLTINSGGEGKQGYMTAEDAKTMVEEKGLAGTAYIIDSDGTLGKAYDAKTTPHMFVIGKEGNMAYMGAIDSVASFETDDIPEATNYVKEAIDALTAGKAIATTSTTPYGCSVKYGG